MGTVWKQADAGGVVSIHVKICDPSEAASGSCSEGGAAYLRDIYGLHGCKGHNCMYRFVSDIFNGDSGDDGYKHCSKNKPHYSSGCSTSITNIRMKASAGTFTGKCAALVSGSSPSPAPTSCTPAQADPWTSGAHVPCCPGTTETKDTWD